MLFDYYIFVMAVGIFFFLKDSLSFSLCVLWFFSIGKKQESGFVFLFLKIPTKSIKGTREKWGKKKTKKNCVKNQTSKKDTHRTNVMFFNLFFKKNHKEKEIVVKEKAIHLVFKFYLFFLYFFVFIYLTPRMKLAARSKQKKKHTNTLTNK